MENIKIIEITNKKYPKRLLKINNAPKKLYAIGNIDILNKDSLAIVGSRDCTEYGAKYARKFAEQISQKNMCIVSGMALGIDTEAHIGALKGLGNTIAVLGAGFNNIYPEENINLFNKILETGGCVITEYPPETKVKLSNYPYRNRIISGMSMGVLVVEARHRSGTSVTAKYAKKQNKKIFCIPGNIDLTTSVGTNRLIQEGAKLVINSSDILQEFNIEAELEVEEQAQIEEEYLDVYNCLTYMPTNINVIANKCNLKISELMPKILMMEIKGYAKAMPGNEYVRL